LDTTKPVAIVGFASSSREKAPFLDQGFEIWTMNHAPISWIPRWDVLFEIHTMEHLRQVAAHQTQPNDYLDWLSKQPGPGAEGHRPIYMQQHFDGVPASLPLPREELNTWFAARGAKVDGYFAKDYYTSTISWMLAMAIMQGRQEIHMYGIDLLQDEEYFYQRAGAEYLAGFARGMGLKVYIPEQSAMCKANYTYGFTVPPEYGTFDPLAKYMEDKADILDSQQKKATQDAHTFNGALQALDLVTTWLGTNGVEGKDLPTCIKEKRDEMERRFRQSEHASILLPGQAEAFRTTLIWTKHYARGGTLNP